MSGVKHRVIEVDDAIVHVYATEPEDSRLLSEAGVGQPLTGDYYYQKHQPHTPDGRYHIHVYKRKRKLFAINWDGTAHDQSHGMLIPRRVYDALKAKFPDLLLPDNRLIEVLVSPVGEPDTMEVTPSSEMTPEELQELRTVLIEERDAHNVLKSEPPSRVWVLTCSHLALPGQPFVIGGAEYTDDGMLSAEGHLFWVHEHVQSLQSRRINVPPGSSGARLFGKRVFTMDFMQNEVKGWADWLVHTEILRRRRESNYLCPYPDFTFCQGSLLDLLALWVHGDATEDMRNIRCRTKLECVQAYLELVFGFAQWSSD